MVKKYIGKVNSSKFRRKNSNTGKKSRKGRKGRKTMKKRRILMGNVNTRVQLYVGDHREPTARQLEQIRMLLQNMPVNKTYLQRRPTEMFGKIFHPVFVSDDNHSYQLNINIIVFNPKDIDKLGVEVGDDVYPLKQEQKNEIQKLITWFSSDIPNHVAPKFDKGYLNIDKNGDLYFLGKNDSKSYIQRDNKLPPLQTLPPSPKSPKSPKSLKSLKSNNSPMSHKAKKQKK